MVTALNPPIDQDRLGRALSAGVDVPMGGAWLFNAGSKKLRRRADFRAFGAPVGTFKVDPLRFSLGVGPCF